MPPTPADLHEIRCKECNRFLCKASIFVGEIKCKCGELIHVELYSHKALTEAFYGAKITAVREEGQKAPEAKARESSGS